MSCNPVHLTFYQQQVQQYLDPFLTPTPIPTDLKKKWYPFARFRWDYKPRAAASSNGPLKGATVTYYKRIGTTFYKQQVRPTLPVVHQEPTIPFVQKVEECFHQQFPSDSFDPSTLQNYYIDYALTGLVRAHLLPCGVTQIEKPFNLIETTAELQKIYRAVSRALTQDFSSPSNVDIINLLLAKENELYHEMVLQELPDMVTRAFIPLIYRIGFPSLSHWFEHHLQLRFPRYTKPLNFEDLILNSVSLSRETLQTIFYSIYWSHALLPDWTQKIQKLVRSSLDPSYKPSWKAVEAAVQANLNSNGIVLSPLIEKNMLRYLTKRVYSVIHCLPIGCQGICIEEF